MKMDDLISRQAAIRWVKTECNPYGKPTLDFESGKKVIEHLKNMPPAQPEHGRWRPHFTEPYENEGEVFWWVCSECEEAVNRKSDYCPNCGALMDEVEE